MYAVRGRPAGRGRPRGPQLHAVPASDRTRSALCGARVGGAPLPWPRDEDRPAPEPAADQVDTCSECAALLGSAAA